MDDAEFQRHADRNNPLLREVPFTNHLVPSVPVRDWEFSDREPLRQDGRSQPTATTAPFAPEWVDELQRRRAAVRLDPTAAFAQLVSVAADVPMSRLIDGWSGGRGGSLSRRPTVADGTSFTDTETVDSDPGIRDARDTLNELLRRGTDPRKVGGGADADTGVPVTAQEMRAWSILAGNNALPVARTQEWAERPELTGVIVLSSEFEAAIEMALYAVHHVIRRPDFQLSGLMVGTATSVPFAELAALYIRRRPTPGGPAERQWKWARYHALVALRGITSPWVAPRQPCPEPPLPPRPRLVNSLWANDYEASARPRNRFSR